MRPEADNTYDYVAVRDRRPYVGRRGFNPWIGPTPRMFVAGFGDRHPWRALHMMDKGGDRFRREMKRWRKDGVYPFVYNEDLYPPYPFLEKFITAKDLVNGFFYWRAHGGQYPDFFHRETYSTPLSRRYCTRGEWKRAYAWLRLFLIYLALHPIPRSPFSRKDWYWLEGMPRRSKNYAEDRVTGADDSLRFAYLKEKKQ